ncbi:inhibitor of the pro-sigma K processing machinery [Anoxybacillus vitaminiphilus]|uniref:Inhibitor of the pro-sigma K processing machinery n=1 Tax=Paranoxybacillus vitaminiphilus TaxID=581036 RepID=A0A327Y359_9BACL|nr:pro-sigmaK processing inhibitor BofA family protein [Anoxybacillus vitaminiphilus]RAK14185.1 inhibitor of the pro-sigma K processing machinery [Anoxybacillus vitaminiphilus]
MEPKVVVMILLGLIILLLLIGTPLKPFRFIGQGMIKLVIGALFLFAVNTIGSSFDIHVPINLLTSAVSGFLGIPGLIALVVIEKYII